MIVRQELVAGTFERVLVSPFGAVASTASMLWFPFFLSMFSGLVMLVFAGLVFGLPVHWSTAWQAIPIALLGTLAFSSFGLLFAAATVAFKQATGTAWVIAGISLVAGIYFPVALLPDWIRWVSDVQPFTPAVDLLRHALVDYPLDDPAWLDLARVAGFALVLVPLSLWLLGVAIRFGQRRGTIAEY
jgi:ABC-2 type transport system permease protein